VGVSMTWLLDLEFKRHNQRMQADAT
jgi:hypothetical protein